jgi:hypothetical protein
LVISSQINGNKMFAFLTRLLTDNFMLITGINPNTAFLSVELLLTTSFLVARVG